MYDANYTGYTACNNSISLARYSTLSFSFFSCMCLCLQCALCTKTKTHRSGYRFSCSAQHTCTQFNEIDECVARAFIALYFLNGSECEVQDIGAFSCNSFVSSFFYFVDRLCHCYNIGTIAITSFDYFLINSRFSMDFISQFFYSNQMFFTNSSRKEMQPFSQQTSFFFKHLFLSSVFFIYERACIKSILIQFTLN